VLPRCRENLAHGLSPQAGNPPTGPALDLRLTDAAADADRSLGGRADPDRNTSPPWYPPLRLPASAVAVAAQAVADHLHLHRERHALLLLQSRAKVPRIGLEVFPLHMVRRRFLEGPQRTLLATYEGLVEELTEA
ncbi:MAG: hypothetical protein ACK4ST_17450, partial [Elioraea tepidiphila]